MISQGAGPEGVCAGIGILAVYAFIGLFAPPATERLDPVIPRLALRMGAAVGGTFAISMLCEFIVAHDRDQNVLLGLLILPGTERPVHLCGPIAWTLDWPGVSSGRSASRFARRTRGCSTSSPPGLGCRVLHALGLC